MQYLRAVAFKVRVVYHSSFRSLPHRVTEVAVLIHFSSPPDAKPRMCTRLPRPCVLTALLPPAAVLQRHIEPLGLPGRLLLFCEKQHLVEGSVCNDLGTNAIPLVR